MEGNRHLFPYFLHACVYFVCIILSAFGLIGYLRYGENVQQLVVLSIPQHSILSVFIDITLIVSVLFTYPLQCYPVIEIFESYIFAPGTCVFCVCVCVCVCVCMCVYVCVCVNVQDVMSNLCERTVFILGFIALVVLLFAHYNRNSLYMMSVIKAA